jgi:hypothetical protein
MPHPAGAILRTKISLNQESITNQMNKELPSNQPPIRLLTKNSLQQEATTNQMNKKFA